MENPQHIDLVQLGATITKIRESKDWSLEQLSAASGLDLTVVSSIETGAVEASILDLAAIGKALGMTLTTLLEAADL